MDLEQEEIEGRRRLSQQELDAISDYLPEIRRSLSDQSILRTYLAIAFGLGLVVHVVAYMLRPAAGTSLVGLADDLLYALGWALWTGVVVVYFVQVLPEAKRREVVKWLKAYEATQRAKAAERTGEPPV